MTSSEESFETAAAVRSAQPKNSIYLVSVPQSKNNNLVITCTSNEPSKTAIQLLAKMILLNIQ